METDKKPRITQEKRTVESMIRLYCRKKEKNATLCPKCEELLRYAHARLDHCPFGEKKARARSVPYIVISLPCANGCERLCGSPVPECYSMPL